jgi:hypothetical protein
MRNLFEAVGRRHLHGAPEACPGARPRCERASSLRKAVRAVLLVSCVPVILAACGSSSAAGSSTSSTTSKSSGTASTAAYTNCLKQHGVTLPNFGNGSGPPGGSGGSIPSGTPPSFGSGGSAPAGGNFANNPKFQKAAAACKSLRPSGGFGGPGGSGGFNSSAFAAYRNCLKLHGVTLPTGGPQGSARSTAPTTLSQSSPTVKAALAACAALQPSASGTTTTG